MEKEKKERERETREECRKELSCPHSSPARKLKLNKSKKEREVWIGLMLHSWYQLKVTSYLPAKVPLSELPWWGSG